MPQPATLSEPLYAIPLTDEQLLILGRINVMWGHIDHMADLIIRLLHNFAPRQVDVFLKSPAVGTKAGIIRRSAEYAPDAASKVAVLDACSALDPLTSDRNHVVHGIWGWAKPGDEPIAFMDQKQQQHFHAKDLAELHNKIAAAMPIVEAASCALSGALHDPSLRNRRIFFAPHDPPPLPAQSGLSWQRIARKPPE
jgi:hypothetical protein